MTRNYSDLLEEFDRRSLQAYFEIIHEEIRQENLADQDPNRRKLSPLDFADCLERLELSEKTKPRGKHPR